MFRPLKADEVNVRIDTINDKSAMLLLYKDARCDMAVLDDTVGPMNWQRKHYECKGNLFCSVGIRGDDGEWIWKDDCGSEGNYEKAKSESSDSFKRACTTWGIGRELYTAPVLKVKPEVVGAYINNKEKWASNAHFDVVEYEVIRGVITKLSIRIGYWAVADGQYKYFSSVQSFKCSPAPIDPKELADTSKFDKDMPEGSSRNAL